MLAFALFFIQTRDRLDVLNESRIARLMECQAKARKILAERPEFVPFDQNRFNPARTISENILNAKRRFDRKSAWKLLDEQMEKAIIATGLRDDRSAWGSPHRLARAAAIFRRMRGGALRWRGRC